MSFFNFPKYRFIISYNKKTQNLLGVMIENYEPVLLKYIKDKDSLSLEENKIFCDAIQDISRYVIIGLMYQVLLSPNKKTPVEMECVYYLSLSKKYYSPEAFQEILDRETIHLAEEAIFESLGMFKNKKDKTFIKLTDRSNIISYINGIFFYKFLNFIKAHIEACNKVQLQSSDFEDEIRVSEEQRDFLDDLIEKSLLNKSVSTELLEEIKESILTGDIDEEILPYVEFLAKYKENNTKKE